MDNYHSRIWGEISFYGSIKNKPQITIEAHENYQKRSSRNRYTILTPNGIMTLSIPLVKGKNAQTRITDVKISYDENWINKHLQAIKSAYGNAAYFEHYYPYIEDLYNAKPKTLFDLNLASMNLIKRFLNIDVEFIKTDQYEGNYQSINLKQEINPYNQVFEYKNEYQPNDSIIDIVFCMGPESILYL